MTPFRCSLALCAALVAGSAAVAADAPPVCPAPYEMRALHLYGTWQAQWQGQDAPGATLQLERHPELGDSVRGRVERDGTTALLAGDVDDGDLTLEESRDGHVVWVRPELVVEVAFNDLQASPQYPGGLALRFARIKGYRPDKSPADADTIATLREIWRRQSGEGEETA